MKHSGFMITRLALTGPNVEDAELLFRKGLNVITGPSDTGKTFAFECIDFMLGASKSPKQIPEAEGYDSVCLDIRDYGNNDDFSLTRNLEGGPFTLNICDKETILKEKHAADNDNSVSQLFLELSNLQGKLIRKNKNGKTRSFSFRDMAHLSIISEEKIIKKISPIFSGQFTKETEEKSAFKLLISSIDDSSVVETADPKDIKKRFEAKEEVLEELIANTKLKIEEKYIGVSFPDLIKQLDSLDHLIQECNESLNGTKESAIPFEKAHQTAWTELKSVESRLEVILELQTRFSLLHEQYHSDIRRLQAIAESGKRLDEMSLEHCPVCGASSEYQDQDHQECQTDPLVVSKSCVSEVSKIKGLISDLELTQDNIKYEVEELNKDRENIQNKVNTASLKLKNYYEPRMNAAVNDLRMHQEKKEHILKTIYLFEQLNEFKTALNVLQDETTKKAGKRTFGDVDCQYGGLFAETVQNRLKAWKFPNLGRVTFNLKDWDFDISGRSRSSHGKGIRAVTHAAFTLSVLRYCRDNFLPHSGIVVIDSPLVVYRQPDVGEENFSDDVKSAFYYDLAKSYQDAQVIIIENDAPPDDLAKLNAVNCIRFTGTDQGRYGFIPISEISSKGAPQ